MDATRHKLQITTSKASQAGDVVPYRHLRHVPPDSIATVVNSQSVHRGLLCPGDRFSARSQQGQRNESGVKID